jgi:hypothetical protein
MKYFIRWLVVMTVALVVARGSHAAGTLTAGDLAWLGTTLNLPADSPVIETLNEAQKSRLHGLIAAARTGTERKRQDVVSFLTGTVGDNFEEMLERAGQLPPPPTQFGANRLH